MESTDSSAGTQHPNLPPGFRFHPTDEELVVHYLKKKASSSPLPVTIIAEINLYKFDPWELPAKATFGEKEWYFFSPRDRKYPNGARPNRAATSGYWKATGTDKPVLASGGTQKVGVKKALVFYGGKPPKGIKTDWIMHEYRLADNKVNIKPPGWDVGNNKNSLRLDDWVLCRIYKKNNTNRLMDHDRDESMLATIPPSITVVGRLQNLPKALNYGTLLENNDQNSLLDQGLISATTSNPFAMKRAIPSLYWNDEDEVGQTSNKRRVHEDANDQDGNNSIVTYLSQIPQTPSLHQQTMLGSFAGDGAFRQPYQLHGLNWYS